MTALVTIILVIALVLIVVLALSLHVVNQYEAGVLFRLGRVVGTKSPGKRAKIIAAEGESLAAAALGAASDTMMAHPLALQLRNLQTLAELGVDKNTTVVFPAPPMSTISELGAFLAKETASTSSIEALMHVDGAVGAPVERVPPRTPVAAG